MNINPNQTSSDPAERAAYHLNKVELYCNTIKGGDRLGLATSFDRTQFAGEIEILLALGRTREVDELQTAFNALIEEHIPKKNLF